MIGEAFYYSREDLLDFASKQNQLPLEETFAFRYVEELEIRLDRITNYESPEDWADYHRTGGDGINIAGYIGDRLCDGILRTWLPFAVDQTLFLDFENREQLKTVKYMGGMYFGPPIDAFEGEQVISEYFSRFLSVPAHKDLERAITKASKYRDLIRAAAKQIQTEAKVIASVQHHIKSANNFFSDQKKQTKLKRSLLQKEVIIQRPLDDSPMVVLQNWSPATVAPEFFQRIFIDTGVQLTPKVFTNPFLLHQLDIGRKRFWQTQVGPEPN